MFKFSSSLYYRRRSDSTAGSPWRLLRRRGRLDRMVREGSAAAPDLASRPPNQRRLRAPALVRARLGKKAMAGEKSIEIGFNYRESWILDRTKMEI